MLLYISIATFCLITTAHSAENSSEIPNDAAASNNTTEDERDEYFPALDWSDTFDWQLLKAVSEQSSKNVLISPLSIKLALLMLYEGSTGLTEKQLQSVLKFPPKKSEVREKYKYLLEALQDNRKHYILNIGTRLFLDSSIKPQQLYASTIKSAYDADIQPTNFTDKTDTSEIINSWIDIVTNGRIREFIQAEDILDDTLLLVSNAVYFKGHWRQEFLKNNTYSAGFYVSPTETVTVQYMKNTDKYYYVESKELDAKILRLPYEGKHFGLFFVLPNSKGGLPQLLKNANLATIKRQLYLLDERTVDIAIPKFKFEFTSHYAKILQEFGLSTIFSNSASFPGIARGVGSGTKWLFVNDIKQKAGIEINEEGSTVYGVTDIQLGNKFRETDLSFNATHPFLIFLEDQTTGSILFAGKVVNPLQTESVIENSVTEEPESTSKPGLT